MRKGIVIAAAGAIIAAGACSSDTGPLAVEMTGPLGPEPVAMSMSGAALDEGIVCAAAAMEQSDWVDAEGDILTRPEVSALAEGGGTGFVWLDVFTCDDGTGSWSLASQQVRSVAEIDPSGPNEGMSSWTVLSGAGDYESLSGAGTVTVDPSAGTVMFVGELEQQ